MAGLPSRADPVPYPISRLASALLRERGRGSSRAPDFGPAIDLDGDGALAEGSGGNDADPNINPGDGLDSDCGGVDEGPGWTDQDGDGYAGTWDIGDCATLFAVAEDCDDTSRSVSPEAVERCNGVDNDCDAAVDEDAVCGDDSGLVTAPPREDGAKGGAGCATTPGSATPLWAGLFLLSRVRGRGARARGTEG